MVSIGVTNNGVGISVAVAINAAASGVIGVSVAGMRATCWGVQPVNKTARINRNQI